MTELCEVVITAPDPEWLKDFSRKLVEQRLCASAHNFAPIRSIYRWRGEIYERTEGRVSLHTRRDRVAEIVTLAKREHPYDVPGISTRAITGGNPDYLAWITQETKPEREKRAESRARRVEPRPDHRRHAQQPPENTDENDGVRSDGKPGPSVHRRTLREKDDLIARTSDRLTPRWPAASAEGSEPENGPGRTPPGPRAGPPTRGFG
jgi:periplasmic divalent cation tolerance protein